MKKILINFAHPLKSKSKINMALREAIADLENVTINDLYDNYPDFTINIRREQKLCLDNDIIIFQHPFYWFQAPAIIKEWLDLVLEYGWAYGKGGKALEDKLLLQVITAGGSHESYCDEGDNRFTISELTTPFRAIANHCSMDWISPFTVLGIHKGLSEEEISKHSENYRKFIEALRDNKIDMYTAKTVQYCSCNLDIIKKV